MTDLEIEETKYKYALTIGDPFFFAIEHDGTLWYKHNSEFKKFEDEKEMCILLLSVITGRYGNIYETREDLFRSISNSYRKGRIDDILK
jgi:hypothetical protein